MSSPESSSLISSEPSEITSYDIPLQTCSNHNFYDHLPEIGSTSFIQATIQQQTQQEPEIKGRHISHDNKFVEDEINSSIAVSHGFFLGKESIQDLSIPSNKDSVEEDEEEDEGIGEIYRPNRSTDSDSTWMRQSDRSFKFTPETTPRHALSQRIGNVGGIGQNIALGHRLGVLTEDATLIPKRVNLCSTQFVITEDSPVQLDINWSKPDNADRFASLIYKIEACVADGSSGSSGNSDIGSSGGEWTHLTDVRFPTFRVYHTDDKLFVGRLHVLRRKDDILIKLRIRTHGELSLPDGIRHWTKSSYSKEVEVTFEGYDTPTPIELQQTKL